MLARDEWRLRFVNIELSCRGGNGKGDTEARSYDAI